MRQVKINTTNGSEIVSVAELKAYAKISVSTDDTLIERMIVQARIWCENYISKDIVAKNRTYYLPETNGIFDLPFAPVASVQTITIDGSTYTGYSILGLDNETIDLDGQADKVKVIYVTSGLSDDLLKQAILQLTTTYYDNRSDIFDGNTKAGTVEIPTSVKNILSSYRSMFV